MKTLAERIKEAQQALLIKKDALVEATQQLEDTPDDDDLLENVDSLSAEVEKATSTLEKLERAEKALAERIQQQKAEGAPAIVTSTGKKEDQVDLWLKSAVCHYIAHVQRKSVADVYADRYPKNRALEAVLIKSAVPLATTFDAGWAAELVRSDVQGFISLLTPTSVAAALATRSMMLNFDGYDSVTVPRRNKRSATNDLGGAFVGEGGAIPLGYISLGSDKLSKYKMAVISHFSRELAERSTPSIEAIIRQAMLEDMSIRLDSVFLGSLDAVEGVQPAGLGFGVTPITGTAGGGSDAVIADIKAGVKALKAGGAGTRIVLVINDSDALSVGLMQTALGEFIFKDDMNSGRLLNFDVIQSENMPEGTCMLIDASSLATAFDPSNFDVSDVATIIEASADTTPPTMADDGAGAVGTANQVLRNGGIHPDQAANVANAGYTARSLWQTNSIGVKCWQPVSWGMMRPDSVVIIDGLTW
jgi:HK97 family phage major capsid protein